MLEILGRTSSINVRKVLWTCAELNIGFEREDWGMGFRSTESPEFLALNPNAMVPVIKDGDFVLWESNTIIRYLAAAYDGASLYPAEPRARALVDRWLDWQAADLNPAWSYAFQGLVRCSPAHQQPERIAASLTSWNRFMVILDQQLATTGAFVAGNDFSLADISIGLSVNRWRLMPAAKPELPAVAAYYQRLSFRPGCQAYAGDAMA